MIHLLKGIWSHQKLQGLVAGYDRSGPPLPIIPSTPAKRLLGRRFCLIELLCLLLRCQQRQCDGAEVADATLRMQSDPAAEYLLRISIPTMNG